MTYNTNGQLKCTTVDGTAFTGLYATDGSYNIVLNTSTTHVGFQHPCGAYNAFAVTDPFAGYQATNGSVHVIDTSNGYVLISPTGNGNFT